MKRVLVLAAVVLASLLAADVAKADCLGIGYARQAVFVQNVQYQQPVTLVQTFAVQVPVVQSQVAVVPVFAQANYGFANAVFVQQHARNVVFVNRRNNFRANGNAGTGAIGIVRAVLGTAGNVVGAAVGR